MIDTFIFPGGTDAATTGALYGSSILGVAEYVKEPVANYLDRSNTKSQARKVLKHMKKIIRKASDPNNWKDLYDRFKSDYLFWKDSIIDDEQFEIILTEAKEVVSRTSNNNVNIVNRIPVPEEFEI